MKSGRVSRPDVKSDVSDGLGRKIYHLSLHTELTNTYTLTESCYITISFTARSTSEYLRHAMVCDEDKVVITAILVLCGKHLATANTLTIAPIAHLAR